MIRKQLAFDVRIENRDAARRVACIDRVYKHDPALAIRISPGPLRSGGLLLTSELVDIRPLDSQGMYGW